MKCTCVTGYGNSGVPTCQELMDVSKQLILVPYFKGDGTINGVDISSMSELDQTFLDGKIQAVDPNLRWYPLPEMKNVTDERADNITEEFEDGTSIKIQDGARTFTGMLVSQTPELKKQLDKWGCESAGVYIIDKSGNLIGDGSVSGSFNPLKIQNHSLNVSLVKTTDTTVQKLLLSFVFDQTMDDANISMIGSSNITAALIGVRGLIDCTGINVSSISTTGFTVTMATGYGTLLNPTLATGLEVADFLFDNITQVDIGETFSSLTEVDGVYTFVMDAQTTLDKLEVYQAATVRAKGYEITRFEISIP